MLFILLFMHFWICHNGGLNNKIDNLHERALRQVFHEKKWFWNFIERRQICINLYKKSSIFSYWNTQSKEWSYSWNHERNFVFQQNQSGNHLAQSSMRTTLNGIDCMFLSCHVRISEWTHTLELPECRGTPYLKQARNLKFKWL